MRDMLTRTIGTSVQVRTELSPELWSALVDPTHIEIAILNLAINSRDAMPVGGTLSIETNNLRGAADGVPGEIGDRECVCLSVRDTGIGMSEEVLRSAVEPFFTTKEPGKGSGLGLSQVYGMVRQSDGTLQIESRVGAGTAVHLYLPRAVVDGATVEKLRAEPTRPEVGGRILVVDDDSAVRDITSQMLRESGYAVVEAETGQAALEELARGETYDLVVIDVAMPGLNGVETVRLARKGSPALRALYITGYADGAGAELQTGGEPMLKKPFRLLELTMAVRDAIKHPLVEPVPAIAR
jgi:CheY-like chemotaxis protein